MSERRLLSAALASAVAALPVIVELAVTIVWWERLPDRIATTFGLDGSPTGYGTPIATVIVVAALQALFLTAAVGSAFARDRSRGRVSCAVTTGFVAVLAISWLVLAGRAGGILVPAAWWVLLVGAAWAIIPYRVLQPSEHPLRSTDDDTLRA